MPCIGGVHQDGPSVEALESQAARQARELEELLTRVAEEAESSSLKNGMEDDETLLSALSREGGGLTLVTSGGEGSLSKNMQLPQPDGPNPVTPDPKAAPSLWGTSAFEAFEGMLTPVKKHVRQQVKRIQQKVEDKVGLLLASQAQGKAHGDEEGQWDDCASGRIVLTEDGHSYEGGLDKNGAMHGYGVLRWSDGHCFQVRALACFLRAASPTPLIGFASLALPLQGGFREGETWGAGRRRWASGHCYTGEEQVGPPLVLRTTLQKSEIRFGISCLDRKGHRMRSFDPVPLIIMRVRAPAEGVEAGAWRFCVAERPALRGQIRPGSSLR